MRSVLVNFIQITRAGNIDKVQVSSFEFQVQRFKFRWLTIQNCVKQWCNKDAKRCLPRTITVLILIVTRGSFSSDNEYNNGDGEVTEVGSNDRGDYDAAGGHGEE